MKKWRQCVTMRCEAKKRQSKNNSLASIMGVGVGGSRDEELG